MAEEQAAIAKTASLYVGDLHPDVSEEMLNKAFIEFKSLVSVRLCRDSSTRRSLCYGYANFHSPEDATRAIEVKNLSLLNGKVIRVMWSHRDPDARKSGVGNIFIKNLSESTDSLKLQDMFQKFGAIISCKVVHAEDGKSKGYGFVQFESETSAKAAIENMNGTITDGGKQMYVAKFVKKSDRAMLTPETKYSNLYMKNLDTNISEDVLKDMFSRYGKILSLVISRDDNGKSRGFGFFNFDNPDDAKRAEEALNGVQLGSKILYVGRAQKKSEREVLLKRQFEEKRKEKTLQCQASNVYIKNIDDDVTDNELKGYFSRCGTITSAKIMKDNKGLNKGFGFVCFTTAEEANDAVYTFHGFMLRRKPLYVAIAQRKEERQAHLQLLYAQRGTALGPPAVYPGGYSPVYYPSPGVVLQIPSQTGMMFQSPTMRPTWRPNGRARQNNLRQQSNNRGWLNPLQSYLPNYPHPLPLANSRDLSNNDFGTFLSGFPPDHQKRILGEFLYHFVEPHQPELASKITGMLLEMDKSEVIPLLESPDSLAAKVSEAVTVLKMSKAKKSSSQDSLRSNYMSSEVAAN